MNEFVLILGMAAVTLLVRYPVLALVGKLRLPDPILSALKYVPPAVLTAIIVPAMLYKNDQLALTYRNDYLIAGIVSAVVAWRTKNLLLTIVLGMVALILWRALLTII